MPTTKDWSLVALLLVFAALALGLVGNMDAQDAENNRNTYCEMVALWDADTALGVAPEHRAGWPPFNGRKQCEQN